MTKILIDGEVVKQALDALQNCLKAGEVTLEQYDAKRSLMAALDAAEKVEPVAWLANSDVTDDWLWPHVFVNPDAHDLIKRQCGAFPVFTHPAPAVSRSPEGTCYYPNNVEPVAWMHHISDNEDREHTIVDFNKSHAMSVHDGDVPLFTHPAPAVPKVMTQYEYGFAGPDRFWNGWNSCREAMLFAAPTPPTNTDSELRGEINGFQPIEADKQLIRNGGFLKGGE